MSAKNPLSAKCGKSGPAHVGSAPTSEGDSAERLTVSIEKAARVLGISRAAAYVYAKDGRLPVIRLGPCARSESGIGQAAHGRLKTTQRTWSGSRRDS